ncbi:hypothetical protein BHM03_00060572 [Ensete ventricosum]|nr:hypothetical protein BHM03_00060572 [Ensete ventricosum]
MDFYRGPKAGDSGRSKGATIIHSYGGDFLCTYSRRTIEPRGGKDKGRSPTSHAKAYSPLYCHPSPCTTKCSLISSYFHDFTEEQTMMLKVFPDDDLRSMAHDHKKEQEKDIHMTPTAMMRSISMLTLPERDNVFVLRADTSGVGISVTLI